MNDRKKKKTGSVQWRREMVVREEKELKKKKSIKEQ
jgi:hypothetical protein